MNDTLSQEIRQHRKPDHPIHPLILNRWSPRAMSGEAISEDELNALLEAARWAPSSYNAQPWRYIYAKTGTPVFEHFIELLVDSNKQWASKAAILGVSISKKTFEHNGKPSVTHAYDTGAAWENMCLEGTSRDLDVHGMEGFDYEKARSTLEIPDDYEILAMFAIGKHAPKESLPPSLQQREAPGVRKKIEEFAMEGKFANTKSRI
jgi:nitroreductase